MYVDDIMTQKLVASNVFFLNQWYILFKEIVTQIARFMGPTWGPSGSCRPQMGPMLVPWTLLLGNMLDSCVEKCLSEIFISKCFCRPLRCWREGSCWQLVSTCLQCVYDDVIKWKHFPRYWPFVREFTGLRWIPLKKASNAELWCFLCSALK